MKPIKNGEASKKALYSKLEAEAKRLEIKDREKERDNNKHKNLNVEGRRSGSYPQGFLSALRLMTGLTPFAILRILIITTCATMVLAPWSSNQTHWSLIILFWLISLSIPCMLVIAFIQFLSYRKWQTRLPFRLTGNFDLLTSKQADAESWRLTEISISIASNNDADRNAVTASLRIFASKANRSIYNTRWGKIERWNVNTLQAKGDANYRVAWKIYRFISKDLTTLHTQGATVLNVSVDVSAELYHIPAESDTMN